MILNYYEGVSYLKTNIVNSKTMKNKKGIFA